MPKNGMVKSRLAAEIGPDRAARVYEQLLRNILNQLMAIDSEKVISLEGESSDFFASFGEWTIWPQQGKDLGERMQRAFETAFQTKFVRVVLIGGDCPEITPEILESAFEKLLESELVVGPSHDGGYYLIGMSRFLPEIFGNMQWSHNKVFEKTIQKAKAMQLKVSILPTLRDIDNLADLNAFPSFAP